jgi:S-adenosyl-L-methionine hydrolase (adenosine-forming)
VKIITLLTDFGLTDAYVGIMKGVILSINPDAGIVDITHEVEAQDIREAAFLIKESYQWFPAGTVHVAVVDPTVGSSRRPIIVVGQNLIFVGPDNGIFTLVMDGNPVVYVIENREFMLPAVSGTFHGRDIFSPAAAHLSKGVLPPAFGRRIDDPVRLEGLFPLREGGVLKGRIVRFDRFGNGITNISKDSLQSFLEGRTFRIEMRDMSFGHISGSYYEGDFTCLFGSSGYLEFGYFKGSFRDKTGARKEDEVRVIPISAEQ